MKLTSIQVKKIREVYGLTLVEMSSLMGVTDAHLCNIENGKRRLTDRLILRLKRELELTEKKLDRIMSIHSEFQLEADIES
ncbi:hypothetical protein BpOF4_04485 [Alkalihalophilus pseudofirmus OF4]|uniref:HTH cro/C1-type domain-containing protein n=1 Tax=Alkalihalophilus pseudofirmus (strain ATCC BAA-2126 / JCM 17055 / OF4) TaxID=398511 RepID=D3FYS8_ALKPO|nr:helix-turn-helix transcriptional regulator [Alkalihalophilus pseudofirmus]ADC48961.1 hypothetical protein BpOF4_04485 [Alkalihalophilus pseudofirmus OF4]